MAKRIILYNLADNITDDEFKEYVDTEKGPLMDRLPSVRKYELVKMSGSMSGQIPYKYCGIMHIDNLEEFEEKACAMPEYQEFHKKFGPMVKEIMMLTGEEIY